MRFELHEQVEVAFGALLPARNGSEDADRSHTVLDSHTAQDLHDFGSHKPLSIHQQIVQRQGRVRQSPVPPQIRLPGGCYVLVHEQGDHSEPAAAGEPVELHLFNTMTESASWARIRFTRCAARSSSVFRSRTAAASS
jgi:hypothetical protein